MKLLAIDTAANLCSVCIYDAANSLVISSRSDDIGRGHAEHLMGMMDACLKHASVPYSSLDKIAVTIGPGSFTGVRVGMAVARGLSLSMDIPVIGVSTLDACEAVSRNHKGDIISLLDAKRGELYAKVSGGKPFVATYQVLEEMLTGKKLAACGNGAAILNAETSLDLPIIHENSASDIEIVARLASKMKPSDAPPEPLYLRSADAKVQAGFALEWA